MFIMLNLGFSRFDAAFTNGGWALKWQVQLLLLCLYRLDSVHGQVRYSIPEEMTRRSFVGNIARDLGLDLKRLRSGSARIVTEESTPYINLDADKGILVVRERIDREQLCGDISPCNLSFEIVLENPFELHRVTVEIRDVNDNKPVFSKNEIRLEISESAVPGARFLLESAMDPDVGVNTLQSYTLNPTDHFILTTRSASSKHVEMVLQSTLDREKQDDIVLILTAVDGGSPQMSATVKIHIIVLDANDNAPIFSQPVYKASVLENSLKGTLVATVNATDADKGSNAHVTYSFIHITDSVGEMFELDPHNGEIKVAGQINFEKDKMYEINIQAKDDGGLTDSSNVIIDVIDVNDNAPVIKLKSFSSPIPEDSLPGTVVALINVLDIDSGKNGQIHCSVNRNIPFKIKSSLTNYYTLVTDSILDRETVSVYNITITTTDEGFPPLSSNQTITLSISDINDNPPTFNQDLITAYIMENNSPGKSIASVQAKDPDWEHNARVSYFLIEAQINETPVSSFISINSDSGILYAVRSFDYEQIREFQIHVKAQDGGSLPLSSNVTVNIFVQDQNDNAPQILYPVQTEGSLVAEMVPSSADVGYLVTKVVAVDADSGQNAWLSYKLHKATDRTLFEVGLQNGEIRTLRQVVDKDAVKQRLVVLVEDNGQPSRSATVNVNVAVADSFPEVLSEFSDFTQDKDYNDNLTFYLVVSLATVSFLFIVSIIVVLSMKLCNWRYSKLFYKSNGNLPVIPTSYYPPRYADAGETGTLRHVYNYEVCLTSDSGKSEFRYIRPCSQSVLSVEPSAAETMPHVQKEKNITEDSDLSVQQKPANTDWRFSQGQRPGPSGSQRPEEAGPWPNPPTEAEQLQALMAAANEVSAATATLDAGTMGLSTRYSPQFTLQHVPDYRQNVYIPGSTSTLTGSNSQAEGKNPQPSSGNKKKSGKKEKK
ncbi:protocadherin gamma-A11-like isoform X2 [Acipenser ruthenus]|uniref:protocadherin gamma-A11-like isoform X2 n=1 Tax=Acipenser ruthenus TaxID=7906 RepID=UPI0027409EBF|nr:protocadherin gamma-A11-like isoform X2 [Acipenser ruthenus]